MNKGLVVLEVEHRNNIIIQACQYCFRQISTFFTQIRGLKKKRFCQRKLQFREVSVTYLVKYAYFCTPPPKKKMQFRGVSDTYLVKNPLFHHASVTNIFLSDSISSLLSSPPRT